MANHEKILESLDTIHELSKNCKHADAVIQQAQPQLKKYLEQMVDFVDNQKSLHYFQANSVYGSISIAKHFSVANLNENVTSLTTDGTYLYLLISAAQRGAMYKIGTGENNTLAGKVYLTEATEKEGEMTWVHCSGKLYTRRANEELGTIGIVNADTLKSEGVAKLYFGDQYQNPNSQSLNRYYPLLTDGKNLFVVTMNTVQKRRKVKDNMRKLFQSLQEHRKRLKEEEKKLEDAKKSEQSAKGKEADKALEKDLQALKNEIAPDEKGGYTNMQDYLSQVEKQASGKSKKEKLKSAKAELLKKAQEQKMKEQAVATSKAAVLQEAYKKQAAPAPGESQAAPAQEQQEIENYKVCEFWVHEFDLQGQTQEEVPLQKLLENDLVIETFNAFSGFFSYEECNRALKFHNDDIAEAVAWLVDEGEKERGKKSLQKKRSVLLAESEIVSENQKKNEVDIVVQKDSVLKPSNIQTGKWTVNDNQITYHCLSADNGFVNIFSLKQEDQRVINLKEIQRREEENPPLPQLENLNKSVLASADWQVKFDDVSVPGGGVAASEVSSSSNPSPIQDRGEVESQQSDGTSATGVREGESIEIVITEDDLFEEIRLYGSFIKQMKYHRILDFNDITYLTYDHINRKFYLLIMGNNQRYIAVAQDLQQMESLLREFTINFDNEDQKTSELEKSLDKLQDQTQKKSTKDLLASEAKTTSEFLIQVLKILKDVGLKRFSLPWRWRPWSFVFHQAISSWYTDQIDLGEGETEETRKTIEQKKKQDTKLRNRIEKISNREDDQLRAELDIVYEEPPPQQKQIAKQPGGKQQDPKKKGDNQQVVESNKQKLAQEEPRKSSMWNTFEYNSNNLFGSNPPKSQEPQHVVPKEKVTHQLEVKKVYSYSISGSEETLKFLLNWLNDQNITESLRDEILLQVFDWIKNADILINKSNPKLVDGLIQIVLDLITNNPHSQVRYQLLWKCFVLGWPLFAKTTQTQNKMFNLIIDFSLIHNQKLNSLSFNKLQLVALNENGSQQESEGQTYYQKLFGFNNLSPLDLFYLRFHYYSTTLYPLEILLQSRVINQIFLVKNQLQSDSYKKLDAGQSNQRDRESSQNLNNQPIVNSFFRPRYDALSPNNTTLQLSVNNNISIKHCKTFQKTEVDGGNVHYNHFNVPNILMLCTLTEVLENLSCTQSEFNIKRFIAYYTDENFNENLYEDAEQIHYRQIKRLNELREVHREQSQQLMNRLQEIIVEFISQDQKDADKSLVLNLMRIYNDLVRYNMGQIDYSNASEATYSLDQLKFIDVCLQAFMKKTLLSKIEPTDTQSEWLLQIYELTQSTLNLIYDVINYESSTYFCKEATPYLLRILENYKLLFTFIKPIQVQLKTPADSYKIDTSDVSVTSLKTQSLLEQACVFLTEGTDFTYEKIFETSHPYPKIESLQKDSLSISKAIGFSIEFDKRCQTESNNDSLYIYSQDHAYWINDTFGTNVKFYGKYQSKYPIMVLGNKINIEFRSFSSGKKQPYRGRGGYGGPPAGNHQDDSQNRWGYKVFIRPIYGEPQYFLTADLKTDTLKPIYRRIGGEGQIGNLVSLMNQLFYTTSKFARSVTVAQNLPKELTLSGDSDEINQVARPNPSLKASIPQTSEISFESVSKYMNWHLFKGGVRTSIIDDLQIPSTLDDLLKMALDKEFHHTQESYKQLEQYKKPKVNDPTQDQNKNSWRDDDYNQARKDLEGWKQLHSSKNAVSSFIKEGDKVKMREFKPKNQYWTTEVKQILEDREFLEQLLKKVREQVPYNLVFNNLKLKPGFKKSYQEDWQLLEQQIVLSMLYHSNSLEEAKAFINQNPNLASSSIQQAQNAQVQQKLSMIGSQLNEILAWMQSRLQGEQDFQSMLRDVVILSQEYIDKVITRKQEEEEKKRQEELEKERLRKEEEEKQQKLKQEEQKEVSRSGAQGAQSNSAQKKGAVVSKGKAVKHAKRKNIVKMATQKVDLSKLQKDKANKEQQKAKEQIQKGEEEQKAKDQHQANDKSLDLESKGMDQSQKESEEQKQQQQKIKYLELPKAEENEIKNKIYNKVYEDFLQLYQGNQDKVKPLCLLLNIQFNPEDPNESLRTIFKRVKAKLAPLIDFEGDMPLREAIDIDELKLESPYQEIRKDVQQRILFLFELKPSVDYHSKVIRVDSKTLQKRFKLQTQSQLSLDDYNDGDSQKLFDETSFKGDDDQDIELYPPGIQRSQSVQVGIQPSLQGIAGVSQAVIAEQHRMKDDEIANWIDNYRKWRQWNRQHNLIHRQHGLITDALLEEDLTSPFCSPLYSIVSFAKSSKVTDPDRLRQKFLTHQLKASLRSVGLNLQDKLLSLSSNTPFQRFVWGNLSVTLNDNVMGQIETAGEKLTQQINENSRQLVKQLIQVVIYNQKYVGNYIYKRKSQQQQQQQQQSQEQRLNNSQQQQQVQVQSQKPKPQAAPQQQQQQPVKATSYEEWFIYEQLRRLIQNLNDIRVLLNNVYSREYIFESLRQSCSPTKLQEISPSKKDRAGVNNQNTSGVQDTQTQDSELTYESIHQFLKSVILLMQYTSNFSQIHKLSSSSTTKLQFQVTNCCKLILNQFMNDKSMMRSVETQKIIQEMLLDIVVEQLEKQCGIQSSSSKAKQQQVNGEDYTKKNAEKHKNQAQTDQIRKIYVASRLNSISFSDEIVSLLKILSEVIRISDDQNRLQNDMMVKQQSQNGNISDQESIKETYFLSEGSEKVMKCAQILAFLMHNTEIPIVMRQTLKCAKLFFKLVDFKHLKLHSVSDSPEKDLSSIELSESPNQFLLETLKKIGQRISNTKESIEGEQVSENIESLSQNRNNKLEAKQEEEKLYVVYGNVNSSEEDYSFLLTALYHWEILYPTITPELPKDPSEILVKSKPKEEEKKADEEGKDQNKPAAVSDPDKDKVSHDSIAQKLLAQIQEGDNNTDLQELISIQRQQQQASNQRGGRGGRGGYRGGRMGPPQVPQFVPSEQSKLSKYGYQFGQGPSQKLQTTTSAFGSIYSYSQSSSMYIQALSLFKVDQVFQEIVRSTHEDCKEEDSQEEQLRKLNESNFNIKVQAHLKDALSIAATLHHRYTAPLTEPLPLAKAVEFSNLLKRAYSGQLKPIEINPYLKDEFKEKKLANQKTVQQCFPLVVSNIEGPKKAKDLGPGAGAQIMIAPKQFVVSIAEKRVSQKYETIVETKSSSLKGLDKNPTDGFSCNVINQQIRRQGASISIVIQQYIQLLRSLITKQKRSAHRHQSTSHQAKHTIILPGDKYQQQNSINKIKRQQLEFGEEMISILNQTLSKLTQREWSHFTLDERQLAIGILTVLGGWYAPFRAGQHIQVEINNQWVDAIVVDDGLGKKRISVLLEDDDTLQLQKIPISKASNYQKYEWPFESELSQKIDQDLLSQSAINIYKQCQTIKQRQVIEGRNSHKIEMIDEQFLLMQLLKVTSQIPWRQTSGGEKPREFIKLLNEISNIDTQQEEKSQAFLEKQVIDSWERLIDKDESKNYDYYVLREFSQNVDQVQSNQSQEEIKEEKKVEPDVNMLELTKKLSNFKQELRTQFQDNEFVQPLSSYLQGLPEPIPKKNQSEAALKLLAHWEKHVIPKIVEFVRTTYKSWEMEFYFEQLRHHLRNGDQMRALDDAMTMCERKLPQGCNIPDDNHDWTAKVTDECIVDTWALAKIKTQRQINLANQQAQGGSNSSSSGSSNSAGDTNYPLLNKLINFGIDEFVILIKAVDNRGNVILAEYQDPDTMQVHSIWIPISFLSDLQTQLPPRSIGYSTKTLKRTFESNTTLIDKVYAKQTLIKFFESSLTQQLKQESKDSQSEDLNELFQLQDILSWCVQEKFSDWPVDGWMKEISCAIPMKAIDNKNNTKSEISSKQTQQDSEIISTSTQPEEISNVNLQEIVYYISDQIAFNQLVKISSEDDENFSTKGSKQETSLNLIKNLINVKIESFKSSMDQTENSQSYKSIQNLVDWCAINWFNLADRIRNDRFAMDLCQQYDKYVSSSLKDKEYGNDYSLMPLHGLMPDFLSGVKSNSAGLLLMFKKNGAHLTPTSKIQFYSDPDKVNLVGEISAGQEGKKDLPPLLLNHGQIWVSIDSGTTALLPKHQQMEQKSSLPCAIVQIPQAWTVCCWLTETITNSLLNHTQGCRKYAIDTYTKLIGALTSFYLDSKAPSMLKSIVFNLLTRLVRKLRFIYQDLDQQNKPSTSEPVQENQPLLSHLQKLFINQDFIETLLCELLLFKEQEEQIAYQQGQINILYPAFVQDCVELIITIMLPSQRNVRINSFKDLIDVSKLSLPDWIQPLIKVAYLMHYFQAEMPLSIDLLKEIYDQTKLTAHTQLDQIVVLHDLPIDEDKYSKKWIREQFVEVIKKHGARLLNPMTHIIFTKADSAVILIDGFNNMAYVNDEDGKLLQVNDSDEEADDNQGSQKLEEAKDEPVQAMPTEYSCIGCTFINPINAGTCEVCGTPRLAIEEIIAQFQNALNASKEPEPSSNQESQKKVEEKKSANLIRMENLAQDLSLVIKREERRIIKEKKQREEEERKAKEAEEKKIKDEEERLKKEHEFAEKKKKEEEHKKKPKEQKKSGDKSATDKQEEIKGGSQKREKRGKKQKQQDQQRQSPDKPKESGKLFDMQQILEQELLQQDDQYAFRLATEMSSSQYNQLSQPNLMTQLNNELSHGSHNDNSFSGLEMEGNDDNDDAGWGLSSDANLSNEQKRDRTKQRLLEMGMDAQMLEQDPDLLEALLESMMAEEQLARQRASQQKAEEDERKRKQKEEEEKKKKKVEEDKKREEMGEEAYQALKPKYTKLRVLVGKNVVFDDIESSRLVFKVLKSRLQSSTSLQASDQDQQQFEFSPTLLSILKQIHHNYILYPTDQLNPLPESPLLDDFEITAESIRESQVDEFIMKCALLVDADVKLFMIMLETQGYDFWFEKVAYPSYIPFNDKQVVNIGLLEKLKAFIEIDMCRETKGVQTLNPVDLRLLTKISRDILVNPENKDELVQSVNYYDDSLMGTTYPEINETLSLADIRYLWSLLKTFNRYLAPAVPYINTSSHSSQSVQGGIPSNSVPLTLAAYMSFTRNLCLMNVKFDLRHMILEKTSVSRDQQNVPKLYFERLKLAHRNRELEEAAAAMGSMQEDRNGSPQRGQERDNHGSGSGDANSKTKDKRNQMDFMFMQAFEQIRDMDLALLRPKKPSGAEPHLSFHIIFRGEHVVGEGGPYRQFFADISSELQPNNIGQNPSQKFLGLLYPSANNRAGSNIGKGKFVLSPSRNTSSDLTLFEFLGILMGVCIRTGAHLNLDLPQFVWKQLVGQKLNHEDLIEIDIGFWKLLSFMLTAPRKLYEDSIFETWAITLSDETLLELRPNGKDQRVEYDERHEFIRQALRARLTECSLQCQAIKRGVSKIVPEALLNMVTYQELETWVCGKNTVDVDLLKRHTKYGGDKKTAILNEDSRRVKFFWEVLREFTEEDKQKFIKFCWGQQRLPANDEEFDRRQVRFMIKPAMKNTHGDGALPKADTCFFNLELPDYSSKEIMKQRILLAIYTDSDSMNAEAEQTANMNMGDQMIMGGGGHPAGNMHRDLDQSYDDEY